MLQALRQLIHIQKYDAEIAAVEAELARLPEERDAIDRALEQTRQTVVAAKQLLERERADERRLENEMRDQEALLARLSSQSSQVTSTQAYEALQHEIEHAGTASSEFETQALELMEAIDQAQSELAAAESRLRELEERAPAQVEECEARGRHLATKHEALLGRRELESKAVGNDLLQRYERIAHKHDPAVVILRGDVCPACRIVQPPQRVIEINRADAVYACATCQRLLVPAQVLDDE